jgi:hypothetical protein
VADITLTATIYEGASTTCDDDATSVTMTNGTCSPVSGGFSSFKPGSVSGYTGDVSNCLYFAWLSTDCSGVATAASLVDDGSCKSTVDSQNQFPHSAMFLCIGGGSSGSGPGVPSPSLIASANAAANLGALATAAVSAYGQNPTSSSLAKAAASAIAAAEAGRSSHILKYDALH